MSLSSQTEAGNPNLAGLIRELESGCFGSKALEKAIVELRGVSALQSQLEEARELSGTRFETSRRVTTEISIKPMKLSDGGSDYFVSIKHGANEVTPHCFRERFKAEYHVALYKWLFGQGDEPDILDFDENEWPARTFTDEERRAFAALGASTKEEPLA